MIQRHPERSEGPGWRGGAPRVPQTIAPTTRPAPSRTLGITAALVLLCACATAPNSAPIDHPPPPPPEPLTTAIASRVVLMSFDGLGADDVERLKPKTILGIGAKGTYAQRVTPVTPTVTSSTHAAILTGRNPRDTGILANNFHQPGTAPGVNTRGMEAEIKKPTVIDYARRAGKRVGSVVFPTVDGSTPRRTPDWGLVWTTSVVPARVVHLGTTDFHAAWLPPGWGMPTATHRSFSPPLRARIEREREQFDLVGYDTTNDRVRNYDSFFVEREGSEQPVDSHGWFAVSTRFGDGLYGAWSKLVNFDPALTDVTLYLGAIHRNRGVPDDYVRMIDDEVGFWPGAADEHNVDRETFIEQSDRLSQFLSKATALSIRRMPFDLLLAYQPIVDTAEHRWRGVDEPVIAAAIADADRSVNAINAELDATRDALVVTGDHGVAAIDTDVHISRILAMRGFAPRWTAYAGGNVALFNRAGEPDDTKTLVTFLQNLATADGTKVFEKVEVEGDVIALAFPRFAITTKDGEPFTPSESHGQHGGSATHHEFDTLLVASGAGVAREDLPQLWQTNIAGYVLRLLGIGP
jgi:hypothetical protein